MRHLRALENLHLIERIRRGKKLSNVIVLTLKRRAMDEPNLAIAIEKQLGGLSGYVLDRRKLTMTDALRIRGGTHTEHAHKLNRMLSYDYVRREFVCPVCGVIHQMRVERDFLDSPDHWRRAGYIVVTCWDCRNRGVA